jgi:hypothetical protein
MSSGTRVAFASGFNYRYCTPTIRDLIKTEETARKFADIKGYRDLFREARREADVLASLPGHRVSHRQKEEQADEQEEPGGVDDDVDLRADGAPEDGFEEEEHPPAAVQGRQGQEVE